MTKRFLIGFFAGMGLCALMFFPETAMHGASDGIKLCIYTVIPSLLPFFVLSGLLCGSLGGVQSRLLAPLCRFCKIPSDSAGYLLCGYLGGYPTGAQGVYSGFRNGLLDRKTAQRLIAFCSNAGPAFFFGIVAQQFDEAFIPWLLWLIHIASSLLTAYFYPAEPTKIALPSPKRTPSLPDTLHSSIRALAYVCGWIVLFRVLTAFVSPILSCLPVTLQVLLTGLLELVSGCCQLRLIEDRALRFVIACAMLSFGGLCITMQTHSAVAELGIRTYLRGKLMQTAISIVLALCVLGRISATVFLVLAAIIIQRCKKGVAFEQKVVYNITK